MREAQLSKARCAIRARSDPERSGDEVPHWRRIGRSYALGARSVTVDEFGRFLKERPDVPRPDTSVWSPDGDGPIIAVSWFTAARYCNWLSAKEGIPEADWCYPKDADIKEGMKPYPDYLKRKGYRLPTEAEFEFAARAGTTTSRYYGSSLDLLPRYAWFVYNTRDRAWPTGQKRPNDLGLFDAHGNIWNWCQEGTADYEVAPGGKPTEDVEVLREPDGGLRTLRGGSFTNRPEGVRSAYRFTFDPTIRHSSVGLRVARTLP